MGYDDTYTQGDLKWLLLVVIVVVIVAAVGSRIVLPGTVAISERNGQFFRILKPGYHLIIPGVDKIRVWINVKPIPYGTRAQKYRTADGLEQSLKVTVTAQILDPKVAAYLADGYRNTLLGAAHQFTADAAARRHSVQLAADTHSVAAEVAAQLTPVARTWGIEVQRVEITP